MALTHAEVSVIDELHLHNADPHKRASGLSDIILGGQDGLVNVLGVILVVTGLVGFCPLYALLKFSTKKA